MNQMEVEEHSHWMEENLHVVVEIPLALAELVSVVGKKVEALILDSQEVEMVAAPQVGHEQGVFEQLKEMVELEIADKVPQKVEQMLRAEMVLMDH